MFTFKQAPVLVPALQQGSLVKLHCILQDLYPLGIQLVSWHLLHKVKGLLEYHHIKPEISFEVKLNPFWLNQQNAIVDSFGLITIVGLKPPDGLPQARFCLDD